MPTLIREGLFIGDINDAAEVLQRGSAEVTHVLSLLSSPSVSFFTEWRSSVSIATREIWREFAASSSGEGAQGLLPYSLERAGPELKLVRMAVSLRDMESENLLDRLEVCLDFVDDSRKGGGSDLVHCFAGVLRRRFESLRQSCEFVCPNDGFLEQLKMFEEMVFKVDHDNPIYKRFHLKVLGHAYNRGQKIDSSKFGADPGMPAEPASKELESSEDKPTPFHCKKCRRVVALQENVINHIPGDAETCFEWQKRKSGIPFNISDEPCSSLFVEPLQWMKTVEEGALEGKLSCAHCDVRLGYFN